MNEILYSKKYREIFKDVIFNSNMEEAKKLKLNDDAQLRIDNSIIETLIEVAQEKNRSLSDILLEIDSPTITRQGLSYQVKDPDLSALLNSLSPKGQSNIVDSISSRLDEQNAKISIQTQQDQERSDLLVSEIEQRLKTFFKDNDEFELAKTIWERGTDRNKVISGQKNKYEWVSLGSSFQINELSASVLLSQLEEESTIRNVREEIYHTYKNILEDIELAEYMTTQKVNPKVSPNYHAYYIILKNNRDNFIEFMSKNGIQTYIGYENLHSSYFGKKNGLDSKLPITDKLSPNLVRLPLHTGLKIEDVKYVCKKIREYFRL